MFGFTLKKILSLFVKPIPGIPILLIGIVLLGSRKPRLALRLILAITVFLITLSSPLVSSHLAKTLEADYKVLPAPPKEVKFIAVLSGGDFVQTEHPPGVMLGESNLTRLVEAVRLWRLQPESTLITTAASTQALSNAEAMAKTAMSLGVSDLMIVRIPKARDTKSELRGIKKIVGANTVVVVSSASHLQRISMLADSEQLSVILAPSDWVSNRIPWWRFSAKYLYGSERIIHEYLGMLWIKIQSFLVSR